MAAHTYICKSCDPARPCICPDATGEPTQCPFITGEDSSEWFIDDTIIISSKFEGAQ